MRPNRRPPAHTSAAPPPLGPSTARLRRALVLALIMATVSPGPATAQEWVPFPEPERPRTQRGAPATAAADQRPLLAPMDGRPGSDGGHRGQGHPAGPETSRALPERLVREPLPPLDEASRGVERTDLAPPSAADGTIMGATAATSTTAADGPALPHDVWRGLDEARIEALFAALEIPPRSPALANLWRRLVTAEATPPEGRDGARFAALRVEALTRSGLLTEAGEVVAQMPGGRAAGEADALAALLTARNEIALGRRDTACEAVRSAPQAAGIPGPLKADAILISGYCAITGGNPAAAGLTADLAREHGVGPGAALAALDALAIGGKPDLGSVRSISPLEYRLLGLAGAAGSMEVVHKGTPATLAGILRDADAAPGLRAAAAEAAVRLNAVPASELAELYRSLAAAPAATADPQTATRARASAFVAAEGERTPLKKVRLIRAFLDDARREGLYFPALEIMAGPAAAVPVVAEVGWFAETAIEVALAAGQYERAREWARLAATLDRDPALPVTGGGMTGDVGPLGHWLALADIADPKLLGPRGASLASVEALALKGRFAPDLLHRLATVLDALDTNVPIPLWEAASRTPQPAGGHLPETGILSELLDASKRKELGRTVLVAMLALGPTGAEGAHMIALGDAIRALKRAGLAADARRLGLEALFAAWPRSAAL